MGVANGVVVAAAVCALAGVGAWAERDRAQSAAVALAAASGAIADGIAVPRGPARTQRNPDRNAYFGDLHVHTRLSFDAYIFNVRATPDDAYRYARGESVKHALGQELRLTDAPLDFLAVTDHAEYLGILQALDDPQHRLSQVSYAKDLFSPDVSKIGAAFSRIANTLVAAKDLPELRDRDTSLAAWRTVIDAAERNYEPGRLTTFVGYEYTSAPTGKNLHRNVVFAGSRVPELPFSAFDSQNPEDLWRWMDGLRARGIESLAIPHNSNASDGAMFATTRWDGQPIDADYARLRIRNEPLVEITQVKGTSETHPSLSPTDEWATFEIMPTYIGGTTRVTTFDGGYVRRALQQGLTFDAAFGANPYRFGVIGSSDTHNAAGSVEERYFHGKVGAQDGTPARRGAVPRDNAPAWHQDEPTASQSRFSTWGAAGIAGVWAEENTREAIFAALRRKETFATSGPRIRVRFFAGYDLPTDLHLRGDLVRVAYRRGVPMGGDLRARPSGAPRFLVWAMRDPHAGWLQRVQVVKGWIDGGSPREQVFDVACSDGLKPDPTTHRCPDNGATVDTKTCAVSRGLGAVELRTQWQDPGFDARQRAFYYLRVLENPSCRWTTWDALRAGTPPNAAQPATIQERAWSSAIWVVPTS